MEEAELGAWAMDELVDNCKGLVGVPFIASLCSRRYLIDTSHLSSSLVSRRSRQTTSTSYVPSPLVDRLLEAAMPTSNSPSELALEDSASVDEVRKAAGRSNIFWEAIIG